MRQPALIIVGMLFAAVMISLIESIGLLTICCVILACLLMLRGYGLECRRFIRLTLCISVPYVLLMLIVSTAFGGVALDFKRAGIELLRVLTVGLLLLTTFHLLPADRVLHWLFSVWPRTALIIAVTLQSVPRLRERYLRTVEAFNYRGVCLSRGSVMERSRNLLMILRSVLHSTLDESVEIARAYQLRGRSC